jgi:hypothetical protein
MSLQQTRRTGVGAVVDWHPRAAGHTAADLSPRQP